MATKLYFPKDDKAKLIKKAYCSVGGKAKQIKRIYASVGGKAKIIYDTVIVTYVQDNGTTAGGTRTTERIAKGGHATYRSGAWYKSDGTRWWFYSDEVNEDITLYEAVYQDIDYVTFDGSHYCPTDVKIPRSDMDFRMYPMYATNIDVQRRVFSIRGTPTVDMYINGSGYWNYGIGNNESSVRWSARANNVKAKVNERTWWRIKLSGSDHFSQVWTDSAGSGSWSDVGAMTQNTTSASMNIGGVPNKTDKPFIGRLYDITTASNSFLCFRRIKDGVTVEGYVWSATGKFYPMVTW